MPGKSQKRENIKRYRQISRQKNILMLQKKNLATDVIDYAAIGMFFLALLSAVIAVGALWEPLVFAAIIPLIAMVIVCFFWLVRGLKVYRMFCEIDGPTTEERRVCVRKITCWAHTLSVRGTPSGHGRLRCIIIMDEKHEKYYYVYPDGIKANTDYLKTVRDHCLHKTIKIFCYKNTRFISDFYLPNIASDME